MHKYMKHALIVLSTCLVSTQSFVLYYWYFSSTYTSDPDPANKLINTLQDVRHQGYIDSLQGEKGMQLS